MQENRAMASLSDSYTGDGGSGSGSSSREKKKRKKHKKKRKHKRRVEKRYEGDKPKEEVSYEDLRGIEEHIRDNEEPKDGGSQASKNFHPFRRYSLG